MAIKSTAFGRVTLTEDDAAQFQRQVSHGRPTKAAILSVERGLNMNKALQANGGKLKMTFSRASSRSKD
ncbi:hypothetical protein FV222_08890 [Methylobacterium sp. WL103]|uniref:hypothetical protein n=1 Tax=Methylobacterium sp. WL103 TaxID=2603891 RepID=UPI0011CB8C4D|nr:hypothetical protein [Methylobacterium sp. WL103]TXN03067.1 hypothetical protein FV222_08890 [Methylobacterium sp. WL103]